LNFGRYEYCSLDHEHPEDPMFQYKVKSNPGNETYMNILAETEDQLFIHIVTFKEGYEVEKKDTMPRKLFDTCIRTGYLTPLKSSVLAVPKSA